MYVWFFVCFFGMIASVYLHFLSVEHLKLQEKYGRKKGTKIAEAYGLISGWSFFSFWIGIWVSAQPRFSIPIFRNILVSIQIIDFSTTLFHLIISIIFIVPGAWLGIVGVKSITLKVAETHRTEKIVTSGVYSIVRHPQYLGGLLSHFGITFLFSALYSLIFTPLIILLIYLMIKKEETELVREFGKEYKNYQKQVPMMIPRRIYLQKF